MRLLTWLRLNVIKFNDYAYYKDIKILGHNLMTNEIFIDNKCRFSTNINDIPFKCKSNKRKIDDLITDDYMSASYSRYQILNDPVELAYKIYNINTENDLIDYSLNKKRKINITNNITNNISNNYLQPGIRRLFENGNKFEKEVIHFLKKKISTEYPKIKWISFYDNNNYRDRNRYYDTIKYINKDYDVIISGLLLCDEKKIFGIPDIIIKSELVNKLFKYPNNEIINITSKYTIIDIKNSNLLMNVDKITMRNYENSKCYKAQLSIYNYLLNIQLSFINNIENTSVFILSNQYNNIINDMYDKIAKIDLADKDNFYDYDNQNYHELYKYFYNKKRELIPKCLLTSNKTKNYNIKMNSNHYPNMKINTLTTNNRVKYYHANILNELTSIWGIDYNMRQLLHKNKIYSWYNIKDEHINKYLSNTSKRHIIKNMIAINKDKTKKIIKWDKSDKLIILKDILYPSEYVYDIYLDFETITNKKHSNMIFLIGCYNPISNEYIKFVKNNLEDKNLLIELFDFINKLLMINNYDKIRIFYWSSFEKSIIDKQYNINLSNKIKFIDLLDIFKDKPTYENPIVIKGAFNYSIKTIAKALNNHGLLKMYWKEDIHNGFEAMEQGIKYYENYDKLILDKIIEYNTIDCKIMYEIISVIYKEIV